MIKDKAILALIEELKQTESFANIQIVDFWEADLCAIGIKKNSKMVYISSYSSKQGEETRFDFDMELLDGNDSTNVNVIKQGHSVLKNELIKEINSFLELNQE
jgi:PBP1b-binding outer membrane lipoprotein LpoB